MTKTRNVSEKGVGFLKESHNLGKYDFIVFVIQATSTETLKLLQGSFQTMEMVGRLHGIGRLDRNYVRISHNLMFISARNRFVHSEGSLLRPF